MLLKYLHNTYHYLTCITLCVGLCFIGTLSLSAQSTEINVEDTMTFKTLPQNPLPATNVDSFLWEMKYRKNPKRAGLYSALLPGLGQVYNRQYWKVGVVYAAIGTSSGFIIYNYNEWNNARRELAFRLSNNIKRDEKLSYLDNNQLSRKQDFDRQNLDMSVLITSGFYLLQIIEAISANHLKDFDITPDISMRFSASPLPNHQVGLGLAFYFK